MEKKYSQREKVKKKRNKFEHEYKMTFFYQRMLKRYGKTVGQFWLIFPNRNYQSCSIEYNFNWSLMPTSCTSSEEENIPDLRKMVKTSRTITWTWTLKVLLTSMRVDRFASCENIVPRLQTSSILLPLLIPRTGYY